MSNTKTYPVDVIRKRLNTLPGRTAMFHLIQRGDALEINRVMDLFVKRGMIFEASRIIDWHSRSSVGLLNLNMIHF